VFNWLEELKRNGKLPGVLVRRTTLDDCTGQRYEELLLALSTMVLKSKIERRGFPNVNYTHGLWHSSFEVESGRADSW
jgi:hypothetical protein